MEKLTRFLSACIIVVLIALGLAGAYEHFNNRGRAAVEREIKEPAYTLNQAAVDDDLRQLLSDNDDLNLSISVTDLQTGKTYHWGGTGSYTAASIGKLITATAYLHRVEAGQASLDDEVGGFSTRRQLAKMIEESDNSAWEELNGIVTHRGLQEYATAVGMTSYSSDENAMTSDDIALLLTKLAGQKLLDTEHTDLLLSLMKKASMRAYIVAAIPRDTEVYHKVGYLADRLHDASIIKRGERSYVLVIFSRSRRAYNFSRGAELFGDITQSTLQAFFSDQPHDWKIAPNPL